MRFSSNNNSKPASLALTSMLDVIFLLLCFFVTASVYSQWESEISIQLPTAETSDEPNRLPGEVIVNVTDNGFVRLNGMNVELLDLETRLSKLAKIYPDQSVIIRADRVTKYEHLVKVIDTCRKAGVWNFSLATSNETSDK
ncbi:MAG: biopolymer transporter ExbD [Kiritimatiellae bacterium]|nr:biopolymer transporter ExbD [Kiritimatiellia bacterium]